MKFKVTLLFLLLSLGSFAQGGIEFSHITWSEAKAKAIRENKLIFIDFYTQWCGPCMLMQKEVFILEEVGSYYNAKFVNLKVDAENGEGIALARKYQVGLFPTFCYIDPKTENVVHRSQSRQSKENFILNAQWAFDPKKNSTYLLEQLNAGNNDPAFLMDLANYYSACGNKEEANKIVEKLTAVPGYSLENKAIWDFFVMNVTTMKQPLFQQFLQNREKLTKLYGVEAVDKKLYQGYQYTQNLAVFDKAPDFKGKDFLIRKNKSELLMRDKKYDEADKILREMMANPGDFKSEVCEYLFFVARFSFESKAAGPIDFNNPWLRQCLGYMQYVVYNSPDRTNGQYHYVYALALEKLISKVPEASKYLPPRFFDPEFGVKSYTLRDPELKQKPTR